MKILRIQVRGLSYKCNSYGIIEKPVFDLILRGKLEIQYDENNVDIKEIDITAKNLDQLIHRLLDEVTKVSLGKLHEILQFLVEKAREN